MPTEEPERAGDAADELLRVRLAEILPVEKIVVASVPEILGRLRRELLPLRDKPLSEVLLNPTTDLTVLKTIKAYAKKSVAQSGSSQEYNAGVAIYFAAIANSLVGHGEKISAHSYDVLESSFAELAARPWMPPGFTTLFGKARSLCRSKHREQISDARIGGGA